MATASGRNVVPRVVGEHEILAERCAGRAERIDARAGQCGRDPAGARLPKRHHERFHVAVADDGEERTRRLRVVVEVADEAVVVELHPVDQGEVPVSRPSDLSSGLETDDRIPRVHRGRAEGVGNRQGPQDRFDTGNAGQDSDRQRHEPQARVPGTRPDVAVAVHGGLGRNVWRTARFDGPIDSPRDRYQYCPRRRG